MSLYNDHMNQQDKTSNLITSQRTVLPLFEDVTEDFFSALKDLSLGELVHSPSFSLEDSICALEMMDPKMDNGLFMTNEPTLDLEAELDPYKVLGMIDKVFAAEMSWQSGHFLSQTVFTNIYIQELLLERQGIVHIKDFYLESGKQQSIYKDLLDAVLWPFIIASIKTCGILCQTFNKGFLYEEEEISSNSFGLSLLEDMDTTHILNLLDFSISWLNNHKTEFYKKDQKYIEAIQSRLKIKTAFLHALSSSLTFDIINDLEYIINIINREILIFDYGEEMNAFFSVSIQAKLSTTMPPRPIMILPMDLAFNNFEYICKDFREILLLSNEKLST